MRPAYLICSSTREPVVGPVVFKRPRDRLEGPRANLGWLRGSNGNPRSLRAFLGRQNSRAVSGSPKGRFLKTEAPETLIKRALFIDDFPSSFLSKGLPTCFSGVHWPPIGASSIHGPARRPPKRILLPPLNDRRLTDGISPHPSRRRSPQPRHLDGPVSVALALALMIEGPAEEVPGFTSISQQVSFADAPLTALRTPRRTGCLSTRQQQHFGMQP
jgi:hypothetical protein